MILKELKYLLLLIGRFTMLFMAVMSCSNDKAEVSKEEFLGHVETVQRYYYDPLKDQEATLSFLSSIIFLEELTEQRSYASRDWFIGYPVVGIYHKDMEYWYSWCERHCQ